MNDAFSALLDAAVLVPFMVLCVRLTGLRSFSKMSSHDFAITVAFGSVLGGTVLSPSTTLWQGMAATAALFAVQWAISLARSRIGSFEVAVDNTPLVLMANGRILQDNLDAARVTRSDLHGKLREAGVLDPDDVHAVVLETTGDISVLEGGAIHATLLEGVRSRPSGAGR